jgi:hypothetical protein
MDWHACKQKIEFSMLYFVRKNIISSGSEASPVARLGAPPPLAPRIATARTPEETVAAARSPEGTATHTKT